MSKIKTSAKATASLDPLTFPFKGSRLIEASAGTGKTWTIAALYVRLVLGHGADLHRFARPLTPPEILVVTYTEAATKELRDRIRARLAVAAAYFEQGRAAPDPGERFLAELRASYPAEEWPACAYRLQLAAESMDEAAVSTIHGWCNRMLREHAFDSGSLFTQKLEADQGDLLAEVVRDYWRTFIVPLDEDEAAEIPAKHWEGPAKLQQNIRSLIEFAELLPPTGPPAEVLRAAIDERIETLQRLKKPWGKWAGELQDELDAARKIKAFDGRQLRVDVYTRWLDALRRWHDDASARDPGLGDTKAYERLSREGMAAIWKTGKPLDHPAFDALAKLPAELAKLVAPVDALKCHAAQWVAARFAAEQERRAQMGFDELLTRLRDVLEGANGPRLAQRIREKFPAALIDEFQDTDPVQYRIFDAVYDVHANRTDIALVLIGDPKQAIFAFRGADIYTYLAARRDCASRLHTLARNFRSTPAMVEAVNRCFGAAETRKAGEGAFLFRSDSGNPVPFVDADAEGRKERFVVAKATPAALTAWWLPADEGSTAVTKTHYLARMGAACATEMVRLLNLGQAGKAGFAEDGATITQPLRPRDMAVLVNTRVEADAIRDALAERGVRSVYLSDRDSVFDTRQAEDIQRWLEACAEPDDARLLRAALATATLSLPWEELERLNRDELLWEERVLQFRRYRDAWRRQGVLPMLRRLLQDFGVPARLLAPEAALEGSERVLTDLLHLAELLQRAAAVLDGEHALIRHLAEQRASPAKPGGSEDARLIRLESDADLVQVVTVYKAKGLEYPLVFLPFACTLRAVNADDCPIKLHDAAGNLQVLLSADPQVVAKADRERLGEDLRKLYVALTRARHATWVGLAPTADFASSAFAHLLNGGAAVTAADLGEQLQQLAKPCASIHAAQAPDESDDRFHAKDRAATRGSALQPTRAARENWWVASYSALKTVPADADGTEPAIAADHPAAPLHVPDTAREDTFREDMLGHPGSDDAPAPAARSVAPQAGTMHAFPRGADVGTFLHDLLEWAARTGFDAVAAAPDLLRDTIARRCARRGWNAWIEPMTSWAKDFLTTDFALPAVPLHGAASFRLATLANAVPEMEFWIAADEVDAVALDRLVLAYTLDAAPRPALAPATLNGMLKGFIDLVFEHEGRYFVADYKSNWLGPDDGAYTGEAMRDAILANRYELQYVLYLLALHRLLKARLPGYDYDRHVGGAVYLFLRGSRASRGGVHFERPPKALIEALDRLFARTSDSDAPQCEPRDKVPALIPCLCERTTPTPAARTPDAHLRKGAAKARDTALPAPIEDLIARWAARGWLRPLDAAFAGFLQREVPDANPWLILAAALASHQLGRGHVCLDLAATLDDPGFALSLPPDDASEDDLCAHDLPTEVLDAINLSGWLAALRNPRLVGDGPGNTPLVLRGTRLYLRRYWEYERLVREGIDARLARTPEVCATLSLDALRTTLDALFPAEGATAAGAGADWQKLACALAARSAFSIITGGPGTGKTTTVVKLLALLQTLALSAPANDGAPGRPLRIRLAAPTGKAAARLSESISGAVRSLPLEGLPNAERVRASIPTEVGTLHRLLGARPDTRRLRHDARNRLVLDVLVIDEASMIDLEMMAAVLAALPAKCRLVLLGDKDQLASVEAGAVLGELCARAREGHYTPATAKWLRNATGQRVDAALGDAHGTALDQAVAMLRKSYRFPEQSGIGQLAAKVNDGVAAPALQVLAQPHRDVQIVRLRGEADPSLRDLIVDGQVPGATQPDAKRHGYRHYLATLLRAQPAPGSDQAAFDQWARAVLEAHTRFQVLCAVRRGPWGVEGLNQRIAGFLQAAGLIRAAVGWYLGRPVLVTRNDYALGLMNGDIGITLALPGKASDADERPLRVAFRTGEGKDDIKWVLPSRLQAVETVYAMTVHKSQGSEFEHAALVLTEVLNPILTRELLYTGVTRARSFLTLANPGDDQLIGEAVVRRVQRASGLLE